jgi:hypothetical protein
MRDIMPKFRGAQDPDIQEAIRRSLEEEEAAFNEALRLSSEEHAQEEEKRLEVNQRIVAQEEQSVSWDTNNNLKELFEKGGVAEIVRRTQTIHRMGGVEEPTTFNILLDGPRTYAQLVHRISFLKNLDFLTRSGGRYFLVQVKHATCKFYAEKIMHQGFSFGSRHAYGHGVYFSNHIPTLKDFGEQACGTFRRNHPEVNGEDLIPYFVSSLIAIPDHVFLGNAHILTNFNATSFDVNLSKDNNLCCTLVCNNETLKTVNASTFLQRYKKINISEKFYMVVDDMNLILPLRCEELA